MITDQLEMHGQHKTCYTIVWTTQNMLHSMDKTKHATQLYGQHKKCYTGVQITNLTECTSRQKRMENFLRSHTCPRYIVENRTSPCYSVAKAEIYFKMIRIYSKSSKIIEAGQHIYYVFLYFN